MIKLFHIDGAMIAQLSDTQLRRLLVEIGMAVLRRVGLHPADYLNASGHQNAADGGVDVRLKRIPKNVRLPFFQGREAILQSKAERMKPEDIQREMRPKANRLRPAIAALIRSGGSYVIASSKENLAQPLIDERVTAMQKALGKTRQGKTALVDFYDQGRLADYANEYPNVGFWVRDQLGEAQFGWEGIGDWSKAGQQTELAVDNKRRVRCSDVNVSKETMTVEATLTALRAALVAPGRVIRLTGQSGTGKTRLAQAVFDSPAMRETVLYADCGADGGPTPRPAEMLRRLIADGRRYVVVLDNCALPLHQACAQLAQGSQVSLLTIEADVEDEVGPDTVTYHLTPASEAVIEELLGARAPNLTRLSRERIGSIAGGNARIALALAGKVAKGEDLRGLPDELLFQRLYAARAEDNPALARTAEVCSLVYSVNAGDESGELQCLAELAELSVTELRRQMAALEHRELIQRRGDWAALLPQALAHRIAVRTLKGLTPNKVRRELERLPEPRLLHSFARRLGFLADSAEARSVASRWIDELMADPEAIDANGFKVVTRLAPLAPASVFAGLERLAQRPPTNALRSDSRWAPLIRHLGYSAEGFAVAVDVLIAMVLTERSLFRSDNAPLRNALKAMFRVVRSGTLAPPQQRADVVRRLLVDSDEHRRTLGVDLADAMLDTGPFTSSFDPSFGAEPRSYGWSGDIVDWFKTAISLAANPPGKDVERKLREVLASRVKDLIHAGQEDLVIEAANGILLQTRWFDGWAAVLRSLKYDTSLPPERRAKVERLELALRPTTVDEKLEAYVRTQRPSHFDDLAARKRAMREVAGTMIADGHALVERLRGCYHVWELGSELARNSSDVATLWATLVQGYKAEPLPRDARLLAGALDEIQKANPAMAETILDDAMLDPDLLPKFIPLQVRDGVLNEADARRLLQAAADTRIDINEFQFVSGKAIDTLPVEVFAELVDAIAGRPDGMKLAFEVLNTRLMAEPPSSPNRLTLARCGQSLFASLVIDEASVEGLDYTLSEVAKAVFIDDSGIPIARRLLHDVVAAANTEGAWVTREINDFLQSLCRAYPMLGLDQLLAATPLQNDDSGHLTWNLRMMEPLRGFNDDTILNWVGQDAHRAAQVARIVTLVTVADGQHALTPLGERLLDVVATSGTPKDFEAFDRQFIVEETVNRMRVSRLEAARDSAIRVGAIRPALVAWTAALTRRIDNHIAHWREHETAHEPQGFERD